MQPLLDAPPPVHPYAPGSWGPAAADELGRPTVAGRAPGSSSLASRESGTPPTATVVDHRRFAVGRQRVGWSADRHRTLSQAYPAAIRPQ